MNSLVYITLFYVNMYGSYKFSKTVRFWPTLYISYYYVTQYKSIKLELANPFCWSVDASASHVSPSSLLAVTVQRS